MVRRITKKEEKEVDIRYNIFKLDPEAAEGGTILKMLLRSETTDYARPEEILKFGMGLDQKDVLSLLIKREGLFIRKGENLLTPMEVI